MSKNPFYDVDSKLQELYDDGMGSFNGSGGGGGFTPTTSQLAAMNSGITGTKVANYDAATNKINGIINDAITSLTKTWSSEKINAMFASLAGGIEAKVVTTMPVSPENNTMYFVGPKGTLPNQYYEQKLRVDDVTYDCGTTQVDLSNYYTKTQADALLNNKQDKLISGTNIKTINNNSLLGSGNITISSEVSDIILSGATDSNGYFKVNNQSFELPAGGKVIVGCRLTGGIIDMLNSCICTVLQESRNPYKYTVKLTRWDNHAWINQTCTLQVFYM